MTTRKTEKKELGSHVASLSKRNKDKGCVRRRHSKKVWGGAMKRKRASAAQYSVFAP